MSIKTKRIILYSLYGVITITFLASLLFVKKFIKKPENIEPVLKENLKPVIGVKDNTLTVFEEVERLVKPYIDESIKIGVNFYDSLSSSENQKESLVFYENTYMPSTGIFYKKDDIFDVVSIYKGQIEEIKKDDLLGNIIKIKYDNNLTGMYECIDNIKVNVGDSVNIGTIIGTSSTCNIFKNIGNGFYFELINNGKNINPEYYYGKTIDEI